MANSATDPSPFLDNMDDLNANSKYPIALAVPASCRGLLLSRPTYKLYKHSLIIATHEAHAIYLSLQTCLSLRDRYMKNSLQRLGDNPQDYDGGDVPPGIPQEKFAPWTIHPDPGTENFSISIHKMPGESPFDFHLDETGVFQVYGPGVSMDMPTC
jgi:hypothetical protein